MQPYASSISSPKYASRASTLPCSSNHSWASAGPSTVTRSPHARVLAAPVLYGVGDLQLIGLHALLPLAVVCVLGAFGLLLSTLFGGAFWSSGLGLGALVLAVTVRIYDAAKPPMPVILHTPVPTAAGDASGLVIVLWQVDALLIATLTPVLVGGLVLAYGPGLAAVLPVAVVLVLAGARRRLVSR